MELKQLLSDDRGVSPVIGVILMVAITVILAAVIGTFVLGLGSNVGNNAPSATFNYDYENFNNDPTSSTTNNRQISITDQGGDSLDPSQLTVSISEGDNGDASYDSIDPTSDSDPVNTNWTDPVTAGDTLELVDNSSEGGDSFGNNADVQVIWQSSGGSSSIISSSTTPS